MHLGGQLGFIVKIEPLKVSHHLGRRLGESRQVENGAIVASVVENKVLGEDRLPVPGRPMMMFIEFFGKPRRGFRPRPDFPC
jgi:hypothetical protein